MNQYIKFLEDNYYEVITTYDEYALEDGVEITIPDGFKELLPLDDGTPEPETNQFVKLILEDDKVYYKFLKTSEETSSGNVRIIPTTQFYFINLDADNETPTEIIQDEAKMILQAMADPQVCSSLKKAHELFTQHLKDKENELLSQNLESENI